MTKISTLINIFLKMIFPNTTRKRKMAIMDDDLRSELACPRLKKKIESLLITS